MSEDSQQMTYEAKLYSEQLRLIENEINRISMTMMELKGSLAIAEVMKGDSIFVPIGGGNMISAKITSSDILIPIGGGYLVNMNKYESITEIKKRISSIEMAVEKLKTEFDKIGVKFREVSTKLESMNAQNRK